jgi:hypothetical protein
MINLTKSVASRATGARKARNPFMSYVRATVTPLRANGSKVSHVVLDLEACLPEAMRAKIDVADASALDVLLETLSSAARNYQYKVRATDCPVSVSRTRIRAGKVVADGTTDDTDSLAYAFTVTRAKGGASASNKASRALASIATRIASAPASAPSK